MRTYQHIIDTKAIKQILNVIPDYCVVRELTERDYGIDLMIELFEECGENKHGHTLYDSSGHLCYLQIKGTDIQLKATEDNIHYSLSKDSLKYIEKFSTPFILVRVSTSPKSKKIYFVWLQRYVSDVLDIENPDWRTSKTKSCVIKIPMHNTLPESFEKIERIAWRIKYIEEQAEFHEKYTEIKMGLRNIVQTHDKFGDRNFIVILRELNRLSHLHTLLKYNNCCIGAESIQELIEYIKNVRRGLISPNRMSDFPHKHNLNLLRTSNQSTRFIEEMEAELYGDTIY